MAILIDGYNLMHAAGIVGRGLGPRGLERSREALLNFVAASVPPEELSRTTVVFDAENAPPGLPRTVSHEGITVRFATDYDGADSLIEELILADSAPRQLVVVSSDHRLHRAARRWRPGPSIATCGMAKCWRDESNAARKNHHRPSRTRRSHDVEFGRGRSRKKASTTPAGRAGQPLSAGLWRGLDELRVFERLAVSWDDAHADGWSMLSRLLRFTREVNFSRTRPMAENPYAAPAEAVGVKSRKLADLIAIARYQKWLIYCIVFQALLFMGPSILQQSLAALPPSLVAMGMVGVALAQLLVLAVGCASVIFLSVKVYPLWLGFLLGIVALVPCLGLLVLLLANARATHILRRNGATVGLLGVRNMAPIHAAIAEQRVE